MNELFTCKSCPFGGFIDHYGLDDRLIFTGTDHHFVPDIYQPRLYSTLYTKSRSCTLKHVDLSIARHTTNEMVPTLKISFTENRNGLVTGLSGDVNLSKMTIMLNYSSQV